MAARILWGRFFVLIYHGWNYYRCGHVVCTMHTLALVVVFCCLDFHSTAHLNFLAVHVDPHKLYLNVVSPPCKKLEKLDEGYGHDSCELARERKKTQDLESEKGDCRQNSDFKPVSHVWTQ